MSDISTLSIEQIKALLAEKVADEKAADTQRKSELAVFGADFIEHVIATVPETQTESTGRVGRSVVSMPYTAEDGTEMSVSIHVTDVKQTEAGKAVVKAKKDAEEKAKKDAEALKGLGLA